MRFHPSLEQWRVRNGELRTDAFVDWGAFVVPGPCGQELKIIASSRDPENGVDWEHVSVSLANRCPNWKEMCFVKDLFWDEEETVMQLHPPKSQWINQHPYCLHLWKPKRKPKLQEIPMPPLKAV